MDALHELSHEEAVQTLYSLCSCHDWANQLASQRPFTSVEDLLTKARDAWWNGTNVFGWLEAFSAHPKIGDLEDLQKKFHGKAEESEQAVALSTRHRHVLQELATWNRLYEEKFGHIFIIFAAGRRAEEILSSLKERMGNAPHEELANAAGEQMKITERRIEALISQEKTQNENAIKRTGQIRSHLIQGSTDRSPVTSHVLDIGHGRPAAGVPIKLQKMFARSPGIFETIGKGITNSDGRVQTLLAPGHSLDPGIYRVCFDTAVYQKETGSEGFYPACNVIFHIHPHQVKDHFHIPLTYSSYGYSTYRGS